MTAFPASTQRPAPGLPIRIPYHRYTAVERTTVTGEGLRPVHYEVLDGKTPTTFRP